MSNDVGMSSHIGMKSHVVENDKVRWMFGWNQNRLSFFLLKYDKTVESDNPVIHLGLRPREIPDGEGLFTLARMAGLEISGEMLAQLYQDRDYERRAYFVLHYPGEFVHGFRTDSLAHAEILKEGLAPARPDQELLIRRIIEYPNEKE
jgi:hypothetical protein